MASLDLARRFAGADPEDDMILEACLGAAKEWYAAAGVPEPETTTDADGESSEASGSGESSSGNKLYDFWIANLAAWMYDNRGNSEMNAGIPLYIVASVHQLRPKGGA